ncbi:hypothetical protein M8J77_018707 [Diaphorina citri]|nr:hypothetical protein M8J77_005444 [Diaphorina citri]KAI5724456.1 hypothetical protein M8J77_002890 [Diaphorina citri]KAI5755663.1 hypothetical protein M8J77_018707 [Diaphorina citri]
MSAPRSYGSLFTSENSPGVSGVSREYKHKFSSKFSSSNHAEPLVLSKKCAIVLPNDEATTVDKYFIVVGEIVGFKNIVYGGKTGQRMIMHLMNEELVESFIRDHDHVLINGEKFPVKKLVNPGFKILFNHVNPSITNDVLYAEISKYAHPVSPMTYVHSGLRDERLSHIFSYRRQVFVQDKDAVPNSITVTQNGETNTIYLTVDSMKCYSCGQEGHAVRMCPNRSQHPAQDRLTKESEVEKTPEIQDKVSPSTSSSSSPDLFAPSFFPELKQPTISFSPPANIDLFQESELKPLDGNIPSETTSTQDLTPEPSAAQRQADELPNEPMEQDEKKRAKRVHPSVEATNNIEKKVRVETEFQEEFLEALESCLTENKSSISKSDILRLFRESKSSRNKAAVISQFGFDSKELIALFKKLQNCKIAPTMKRQIKTLLKNLNISDGNQEYLTSSENEGSEI